MNTPDQEHGRFAASRAGHFLRLAFGILLLFLAFYRVDFGGLAAALRNVDSAWLFAALGAAVLDVVMKVLRWRVIVRSVLPEERAGQITRSWLYGYVVNLIFPFRSGDLVRPAFLTSPAKATYSLLLAGTVIEKAVVLSAAALFAAALLPLRPAGVEGLRLLYTIVGVVGVLLLMLVAGVISGRVWPVMRSLLQTLRARWAKSFTKWGDELVAGYARLRVDKRMYALLPITLVSWAFMVACNYAVMRSLDMAASLSVAVLAAVLIHLGVAPALMPGNVGPFHFLARYSLEVSGYSLSESAAFAVTLFAVSTLPPLLGAASAFLLQRWPGSSQVAPR